MSEIILEMKNIIKRFGMVTVLKNVNFQVKRGEIHALCGENGAGKSTLMKVLSGVYSHGNYEGDIIYNDEICEFHTIKNSEEKGIVIIHQELALIPHLSIAENIFVGNEITNRGVIDWHKTAQKAQELMNIVGLKESPYTKVMDISVGKQQLVEIAKALSKDVNLLILDEPTSALNEDDSENLLLLLEEFRNKGITSIIISHKLNEITKVSDSVTILRDGETIQTLSKKKNEISEDSIIKGMVGRTLENRYPQFKPNIKDIYFEVKDWTVYHPTQENRKMVDNVNFHIKQGEIVGIAGLMGAGRSELALSIFGKQYGSNICGTILKAGKEIRVNSPNEAIKHGIAYVSEDRKSSGLVLMDDINHNISMAALGKFTKKMVIDKNLEAENANSYKQKLNIKSNSIYQKTGDLSGGNQQKVVLAKWLTAQPDILILDEPTRGIDVGAKFEIYTIIQEMAQQGKAICLISSELPEILGMCDRIYTMSSGKFTGEVAKADASQEVLMGYMTIE